MPGVTQRFSRHTGTGKGKSTAAFGMALRAWNAGLSVAVFQFVKSAKWKVGRSRPSSVWPGRTPNGRWRGSGVAQDGRRVVLEPEAGSDGDHAATAAEGWAEIAARLAEQRHDFYVLDEFTYPLTWGWVDAGEVVEVLAGRPGRQHVVITGRDAPQSLIDIADLATEMTKVKHFMDAGRKASAVSSGDRVSPAPPSSSPPVLRQRKDHGRNGVDGSAATGRRPGGAVQGRMDFIDPAITRWRRAGLAAIDPVLVGVDLIGPLYRYGTADADIAVVEG